MDGFSRLSGLILNNHPALFKAAEAVSTDPLSLLLDFGPLGIIVVLYVADYIPSRSQVKDLKAQNAELREIIARFQMQASQTVPALARSAQVLEAIPAKDAGFLDEIRQTEARIVALVARLEDASRKQEGQS